MFLTTPNRWFPVEFHSLLPLLHWLPKRSYRRLLSGTRYDFFAQEDNLNLLDRSEILRLCSGLAGCTVAVESQRLIGIPSNLLITIEKSGARACH